MIEQIINFETAKLAKKKKFKSDTFPIYFTDGTVCTNANHYLDNLRKTKNKKKVAFAASTQSLLQKWLREKHNLHIYISTTPRFDTMQGNKYKAQIATPFEPFKWNTGKYYLADTYEEVLEQALQQALNLI